MCANDGKGHRRQDGSDAEFTAGDVRINWSGCGGSRQLEIFREVIPISLGMPYVHVSNALHPDYSGYTPMCVYDWLHETTPEALARNRKGVANFVQMFTQANTAVGAHAERIGLKVEWQNPSTTISKLAWLTQTPKEFDFESSHWPPQFYHTGPFHDGANRESNVRYHMPARILRGEEQPGRPADESPNAVSNGSKPYCTRPSRTDCATWVIVSKGAPIVRKTSGNPIITVPNDA